MFKTKMKMLKKLSLEDENVKKTALSHSNVKETVS